MSVYHEFDIKVDSEHRKMGEQHIIQLKRDGNGGLMFNVMTDHLRNREEWLEVKAALTTAGAQLGWY